MNRETLINRYSSPSSQDNYRKAFKKFDSYLSENKRTEEDFLKDLEELSKGQRYELLQSLIEFISQSVSPRSARDYFDRLFKYFLLCDCPLDYTQKKILLRFPRIIQRRLEGLDRDMIVKELEFCSDNFGNYLRFCSGSGSRETEALKIEPWMIHFEEYPVRVEFPSEITKFGIERESFLPPKTAEKIKEWIERKGIKQHETVFCDNWNENTLIDFEKYFEAVRRKAGFETKDRKKYQQNDITLHSHRAFYITTFEQNSLKSFGHATAGHSKDLSVYFRTSLKVRQQTYAMLMDLIDF